MRSPILALLAALFAASLATACSEAPDPKPAAEAAAIGVLPKHGGRIVPFSECGGGVEVVQDLVNGTLTIYESEEVPLLEAPVLTLSAIDGPVKASATEVEGQPGAWQLVHRALGTTAISGRIRILRDGNPCEADVTFMGLHGGPVVAAVETPVR